MDDLDDIAQPVKDDLERVKEAFASLLKSPVTIINIIARHLVKKRGKGLRPLLVLLCSRICGSPTEESYKAAALIEMLHNATLIHDDVVDEATVRRGGPTLNAIWKNKISVLMGDYILARSLTTAVELHNLEAINVLSESSARMSQGEIAQMLKSRKSDLDEDGYFQIIGDKTAALISASCQLGALAVSASAEEVGRLRNYGENFGLAFQIKDDLLDLVGEEKFFGKKRGTDLRNGRITLPLIHALRQVKPSVQKSVIRKVKKKSSRTDVKYLISFIKENGGLDYAERAAEKHAADARAELSIFPDSEYKDSLLRLTKYIVDRNK